MFLLDTDVLSALMLAEPPPEVAAWMRRRARGETFISAITCAEIEYGILRKPDGKKKIAIRAAADKIFREYAGRCLPFDRHSAPYYAAAKNAGKTTRQPTANADMMIAAVAMQNRLTLATRNIRHFAEIGAPLKVVNPWN